MENDTTNETLDSINETETVDTESTEVITEDTSTSEEETVDVARLQETNKKLFERAKKAEAELKKIKTPQTVKTVAKETTSQPSNVEETVLLAQGMSEDMLATLKKVAAVNGTSLIKAQNDPIFVAIKEKNEKEITSKKANVGASKGSGGVKAKKDFNTPGLTREEHMALFNEKQGM